ncbi:DENN domain-containing protein 1B-like isoform X2 [Saccostrea echinata]|uniref:DENN domain-containing protein 1B-like isoform X2 n=1 Tax=Saccostrea echinata TaxID=191078 RepID=UPI002A81FF99|nr:DENN domain-containing protein 1B-like isoform X2 [Saccostrea echinata]
MGSRLRANPERIFEVFLEVAKPDGDKDGKGTFIVQKYPPTFNDEDTLKSVPSFAFPCETDRTTVDHFTFVLTDLESKYKFGYCRYATGAQTCLCIVSCLPWFEVFYSLLNLLAEMINRSEDNDVTNLLRAAYANGVPSANVPTTIVAGQEVWKFTPPDLEKLPSIPTSRNLTEYYNAVDTEKMMIIFASMLNERRILITSKRLNRLTACVHASATLLYPMHWQHLFIPVLPAFLIDYLSAPMPYLIGAHKSLVEKMRDSELGDAVVVDVDENKIIKNCFNDLEELPSDIQSYLKKHLKKDKIAHTMATSGDAIPKTFLMALVKLIGGYRDALKFHPGEEITFNPQAFVQSRPENMQPFLEKILHLQIFQEFINERLDMLNCGEGFTDIFEREAMTRADRLNTQSRYKDWLHNVKSQGKRIQRGGKDVWADFKEKAAPTVTNVMDTIRDRTKKNFSNFKEKFTDLQKSKDEGKSSRSPGVRQHRPKTINLGQDLHAQRPMRPGKSPDTQSVKSLKVFGTQERMTKYKIIEEKEKTQDDSGMDLPYNRVSINLLGDPDIQNALNKSASAEDLISPRGLSLIDMAEESDSSCNSSPAPSSFPSLIEFDSHSIGSTGTQDSFSALPLADGSDSQSNTSDFENPGSRPVAPPRRRKMERNKNENLVVKDRIIGAKPRPAPRKSLTDEVKVDAEQVKTESETKPVEVVSKPLIQLDSVDDDFDPFSSPRSQTVGTVETLREKSEGSPLLLRRADAFKKQNGRTPRDISSERKTVNSVTQPKKGLDGIETFDPLSNTSSEQTEAKEEPRKSVHELMQAWELNNLPISQNQSHPGVKPSIAQKPPHLGFPCPPHFTSSHHQPLSRLSNFSPHKIQQASVEISGHRLAHPSVHSSVASSQRTSGSSVASSTASADRSSDPFTDLLEQSLKSGGSPSPQKKWETFE